MAGLPVTTVATNNAAPETPDTTRVHHHHAGRDHHEPLCAV